jgi:hypothetical protein
MLTPKRIDLGRTHIPIGHWPMIEPAKSLSCEIFGKPIIAPIMSLAYGRLIPAFAKK